MRFIRIRIRIRIKIRIKIRVKNAEMPSSKAG